MIGKEELSTTLYDLLGDELMDVARADLAEALLEKYILVERPEIGEITVDDGRVIYGGTVLRRRSDVQHFREELESAERAVKVYAKDYAVYAGVVALLEGRETEQKHERREEISKEMGHPVYMYAPQPIKTLIARLVDEEFKNADKN